MKNKKLITLFAATLGVVTAPAFAAIGDTRTYQFNLPATSSFSPPYPVVADIKLTEIAGGVEFILTPNWNDASTGYKSNSRVDHLEFVYQGSAAITFAQPAAHGADIKTFTYNTNQNMDSGYKSDAQNISIDWFPQNHAARFDNDFTNSVWTVSGADVNLLDFIGTQATTNSGKPDPIFGVISVAPYALTNVHPTPSNWVALSPVPEPQTYAMLLAGLGVMGFMARRRKTS